MSEKSRKILKYIGVCLAAGVLASYYFAGALQTLFATDVEATFNPFKILRCTFTHGLPKAFLPLLLVLLIVCAVCAKKVLDEIAEGDDLGRAFKRPKGKEEYGGAHFATYDEYKDVARITRVEKAVGTIYGQLGRDGSHVISRRMSNPRANNHIAVYGASGSGKTYTFSKPYIFQAVKRRESLIITDPDGGLYRDTASFLVNRGYVVKCLNLVQPQKSNCWDCMSSLLAGGIKNIETNAEVFTNTLMRNAADDTKAGIYTSGPQQLVKALILRVYLGADFPQSKKNLKTVYNLLMQEDKVKFLKGLFATRGAMYEEVYQKPWFAANQSSEPLFGNIMTNLTSSLEVLQNEQICDMLSLPDIDLSLPGERPCAYFCRFPDYHNTFHFIETLFVAMLCQTLIVDADNNIETGGKLKVPVNFLLDEFPSVGTLPDWANKMATVRKRNINVCMIFQNLTQLQVRYDLDWETILSNCSTWVALGVNDTATAEYLEKRIGETTIQTISEKRNAGYRPLFKITPYSESYGLGRRSLLNVSELYQVDKDKSLIIFQQHNVVLADKYPYVLHPCAKECELPNPLGEIPDLDETEARAEYESRALAIVQEYEEAHATPIMRENEEDEADGAGIIQTALRELYRASKERLQRPEVFEIIPNEEVIELEEEIELEPEDEPLPVFGVGDAPEEEVPKAEEFAPEPEPETTRWETETVERKPARSENIVNTKNTKNDNKKEEAKNFGRSLENKGSENEIKSAKKVSNPMCL